MSLVCYCGAPTRVVDSREHDDSTYGGYVRRRRVCENGHRYSSAELPLPMVDEIRRQGAALAKARVLLLEMAKKITYSELPDMAKKVRRPRSAQPVPAVMREKNQDGQSILESSLRHCEKCGVKFATRRAQRFCSPKCRTASTSAKRRLRAPAIEVAA